MVYAQLIHAPPPLPLAETVRVDDITGEMNGQPARFRTAYATTLGDGSAKNFTAGGVHLIGNWNGSSARAEIEGALVPKILLDPAPASATGVRRYDVGLDGQRRAVKRNKARLAGRLPQAERDRLTRLLTRRQRIYSQMWVRQMMYNRFDADILRWTDHYNTALGASADPLDPNIPKSIFFQESRMGTNGYHLLMPPYSWTGPGSDPIKSRFNLGQAIDSWGPQQWLMMKEMHPMLWRYAGLDALEARRRWLGMTGAEYDVYPNFSAALQVFFETRVSGVNLMGSLDVDLHLDYAFWIRTAIRWLFHKKTRRTWPEAVRAYNGGGASAARYRTEVMARVSGTGALTVREGVP